MFKFKIYLRFLFIVIALAIGTALAPTLTSCNVIDNVAVRYDRLTSYNIDSQSQMKRFADVYDKYVIFEAGNREIRKKNLEQFRDAIIRVRLDYVRDVPESTLIKTAIDGMESASPRLKHGRTDPNFLIEVALDKMMSSLDPHSSYLNPAELKEMKVSNQGEFGGLGLTVTMEGDFVKVIAPLEDTPAFRAGLKTGDLISHLNGEAIKGKDIHKAVSLMRGRPGTQIRLTVKRGELLPFDVKIRRAIINVKSVRWRIEGDVGYVRIVSFTEKVASGIDDAMEEMRNKLGDKLAGIVLDLRNNPGGLLHQSLTLSDAFLEEGVIVTVEGRREGSQRIFEAERGDLAKGLPIVVLINPGSASASEIVAAALQDHKRATIMGQRSFGKGSVQTITPLPQEGALRLTTQLYFSPSGRAIQARGIIPDIEIIPMNSKKIERTKSSLSKGERDKVQAEIDSKNRTNRQRESDLPGALSAVGNYIENQNPTLLEEKCTPAGKLEDRALGCALALIQAESRASFLASFGKSSAM